MVPNIFCKSPHFVFHIACYSKNSGEGMKFLKIECIKESSHIIGFVIKLAHESTGFFYV